MKEEAPTLSSLPWSDNDLESIKLVLIAHLGWVTDDPKLTSSIRLSRMHGLSDAAVYEATLQAAGHASAHFVLRWIEKSDRAAEEHAIIRQLQSIGADVFCSRLVSAESPEQFWTHTLIVRHARDEISELPNSLQTLIRAWMGHGTPDPQLDTSLFRGYLVDFWRRVENSFAQLGDTAFRLGPAVAGFLANELGPDVLIDVRKTDIQIFVTVAGEVVVGGTGGRRFDVRRSSVLSDPAESWALAELRSDFQVVWLIAHRAAIADVPDRFVLVLPPRADHLTPDWWSKTGNTREALVSKLTDSPPLVTGTRHGDLHLQNVVGAVTSLKLVDFGETRTWPVLWDLARLELSIWEECHVPADQVAHELLALWSHGKQGLAANASETAGLVADLRQASIDAYLQVGRRLSSLDLLAAFACQTDVILKYHALNGTRPSQALYAAAIFWTRAYSPSAESATFARAWFDDRLDADLLQETSPPRILHLWGAALGASRQYVPEALGALYQNRPEHFKQELTPFQRSCLQTSGLFDGNEHLLLSGPTGCGKSTIAEAILVSTALRNSERPLAMFIAPTRALAQAKYRELTTAFRGVPALEKGLILSTGEDKADDGRLVSGDFTVACLVYEKANGLFSRNPEVLQRLGVLVVDEVHLIEEPDRGPFLEVAIGKAIRERAFQDANVAGFADEKLRIAVLSTEPQSDGAMPLLLHRASPNRGQIAPLTVLDDSRPVDLECVFVLPPVEDDSNYGLIPIVRFSGNEARKLPSERMDELKAVLTEQDYRRDAFGRVGLEQQAGDSRERLTVFVSTLLDSQPADYRCAVFVPGRPRCAHIAGRLWKLRNGVQLEPRRLTRLQKVCGEWDDRRLAKLVMRYARRGVFLHHSEVDPAVRAEIERLFGRPMGENSVPEVLVTTTTLSYGVNLAIQDVVLDGVHFPGSKRESDERTRFLPVSEFHNIGGRAGRLGVDNGERPSHFYVALSDRRGLSRATASRYFAGVPALDSRLFLPVDQRVINGAEELREWGLVDEAEAAAVQLSDTFASVVLDIVRHLNRRPPRPTAGTQHTVPVGLRDVIAFVTNFTLFSASLRAAESIPPHPTTGLNTHGALRRVRRDVVSAVTLLLDDCVAEPLVLLEERGAGLFFITERGEAIIDTGTSLRTVRPLLTAMSRLEEIWSRTCGGDSMPEELFILPLLLLPEVFESRIDYMPECAGAESRAAWPREKADLNRNAVRRSYRTALEALLDGRSGVSSFVDAILELVEQWPEVQSIAAYYDGGAADAVVRLHLAMLLWVGGKDYDAVRVALEQFGADSTSDEQPVNFSGLPRFVELLRYKAIFLSKLLLGDRKERAIGIEGRVFLLAERLRLGCSAHAVHLFLAAEAARLTKLKREESAQLMREGMTADLLACASLDDIEEPTALSGSRIIELRSAVREYACRRLRGLVAIFSSGAVRDTEPAIAFDALQERMPWLYEQAVRWYDRRTSPLASMFSVFATLTSSVRFASETPGPDTDDMQTDSTKTGFFAPAGSRLSIVRREGKTGRLAGTSSDELLLQSRSPTEEDQEAFSSSRGRGQRFLAIPIRMVQTRIGGDFSVDGQRWQSPTAFVDTMGGEPAICVCWPWCPEGLLRTVQESHAVAFRFLTPAAFIVGVNLWRRRLFTDSELMGAWRLNSISGSESHNEVVSIASLAREMDGWTGPFRGQLRETVSRHFELVRG